MMNRLGVTRRRPCPAQPVVHSLAKGDLVDDRDLFSESRWYQLLETADAGRTDTLGDLRAARELGIVQDAEERHRYLATIEPWWATGSKRAELRGSAAETAASRGSTESDIAFEFATALGIEIPHEAFGLERDSDAIYSTPGMYRWRGFMWACVSAGDEFETGPPDAQIPRDHGIARLGVPASTAPSIAMAEAQLPLDDAASSNAGLEKVTDCGR